MSLNAPTTRYTIILSKHVSLFMHKISAWCARQHQAECVSMEISASKTNGNISQFISMPTGIPYKSNGYASEPDANYDSDYALKYHSADRKRTTSIGNQYEEKWVVDWILKLNKTLTRFNGFAFHSRHGSYEQPVKQNIGQYKIQPGKIEHYTPGKSSVSDKEAKQVIQWSFPLSTTIDAHSLHDSSRHPMRRFRDGFEYEKNF